jgi:glycosyltransferase involved in cell wall biosynthesis
MKVWLLSPKENWIVDEMAKQFKRDNSDLYTDDPLSADIAWVLADWCFDQIEPAFLAIGKPIVVMLHHFVPEKFDRLSEATFRRHDKFVSAYTAPNYRTRDFVLDNKLTNKPVYVAPYWVDSKAWISTGTKEELRRKYRIPQDAYVIGSFQRDTEGAGIPERRFEPKKEKGPDLFCDFVEEFSKTRNDVCVVLAGWRRQYIVNRLRKSGSKIKLISFAPDTSGLDSEDLMEAKDEDITWVSKVSDKPPFVDQSTINELYQTLDLYPMCSRFEGGPQSLLECGIHGIKMVSRPVGMAEEVLKHRSIANNPLHAEPTVPDVEHLKTPLGYARHIEILKGYCK